MTLNTLLSQLHKYGLNKSCQNIIDARNALIVAIEGAKNEVDDAILNCTVTGKYEDLSGLGMIPKMIEKCTANFRVPAKFETNKAGKTGKKAPRLTFEMLNIPVGSVLIYKDDANITCKTIDMVNYVECQGRQYSLSGLAQFIRNTKSEQGGKYFMYNGKILTDLRREMEL